MIFQKEIQIITPISEKEKSKVYLVSGEKVTLYIMKEFQGEEQGNVYRRIQGIHSEYLPKIFEVVSEQGKTYVLEEYVEGVELGIILEKGQIDYEQGIAWMRQLMGSLKILHQAEPAILHRDIKPDNILITPSGNAMLLDFDAARSYSEEPRNQDTVLLGTRGYASPEQFGFSQTDARSDIYSLGIVCSEIMNKMNISKKSAKKLQKIVDKATMFDPAKRYQTIEELEEAFERRVGRRESVGISRRMSLFIVAEILLLAAFCIFLPANRKEDTPTENLSGIYDKSFPRTISYITKKETPKKIEGIELKRYTQNWQIQIESLRILYPDAAELSEGMIHIRPEALSGFKEGNYLISFLFDDEWIEEYELIITDTEGKKQD